VRVEVKPELLHWAIERSGSRRASLYERFPRLSEWELGETQPTLKQLESFANTACVPVGYLFLPEPPEERLPIADMRIMSGRESQQPSPDLLDVIYLCQRRQNWYREYAESIGEEPKGFVGSARISHSPKRIATEMRHILGFSIAERRQCSTWEEALRRFVEQAERMGILVMVSGVVGSNNTRVLDPEEFRGFALADEMAPLVFVNGADTKAAQMFTLAHELAHIWLGKSAVSDAGVASITTQNVEVWCNAVAAELLVPLADLQRELGSDDPVNAVPRLARAFKVSTLVILRRLLDAGSVTRNRFEALHAEEMSRLTAWAGPGGGNFYLTQSARLSRRFARAIIASALEGQTLFRDAYQMLGIKKDSTFRELGRSLEVLS
jgi:Zn-dependent peptidase ImmA (M78 family)